MIDIYLITNQINGKQYVGKTQKGYKYRFHQHCLAYEHGVRNYISCAIHKYGKDNFHVELIKQVEDDTWEYWENYYIRQYHTHYTEGGYNITWGGDSNPMDVPAVRLKHDLKCKSESFRELQHELSIGKKHTEETKKLCQQNTLNNLEVCTRGFRKYNDSKKVAVGMLQDDKIVKIFESASAACAYFDKPTKEAGHLLFVCDKFNKNGKRARFFGYSWTRVLT